MNSTICSTSMLIGIHVVVGGWRLEESRIRDPKYESRNRDAQDSNDPFYVCLYC